MQYLKRTSEILQNSGLSLDRTYFLLSGSFGDKYFILSMLHHLTKVDPSAAILINQSDRELARIFLGKDFPACMFLDQATYAIVLQTCRDDPNSYMPARNQDLSKNRRIPKGCIRSLHAVDYPYFPILHSNKLVRYIELLRIIMGLHGDPRPRMPPYLEAEDEMMARRLFLDQHIEGRKTAIVNIVCFSHENILMSDYEQIDCVLRQAGLQVVYNISQNNRSDILDFVSGPPQRASTVVPPHLVIPFFTQFDLVIGVWGGAMAIADSFCKPPVFSIFRPAKFFPSYDCHGGFAEWDRFWPTERPDGKPFREIRVMNAVDANSIGDELIRFISQIG